MEPGPWGQLEYYYTFLMPPDELVELVSIPSEQTEWHFFGLTLPQIDALIGNAGVTPLQHSAIMDPARIISDGLHHRIFPPAEAVRSLSPAVRANIYRILGQWELNRFHHRPFRIGDTNVTRWFEGSDLTIEQLHVIADLAYGDGSTGYFFSDLPYLLRHSDGSMEEKNVVRSLSRVRTLMLRLCLSEHSNLADIAGYWTKGRRFKTILPILESVQRTPGVDKLDVAHLLPPTPRKHLFTFPSRSEGLGGRYPDWFWTCTNFFQFVPTSVFADDAATGAVLEDAYLPVEPPLQFGDLIVARRPGDGVLLHGCVHIAGGIVYTKSGPNAFEPWVLLHLRDALAPFSRGTSVELTAWRRRDSL